jgi:hypothetical protein
LVTQRAGKCICISDTHQKYKLGTVYAFELKGYSKITYGVVYSDRTTEHPFRRLINFDEVIFNKNFEEVSVHRDRLINEILN